MFRTQSKETYESGLYTTVGMDIVVTAERVILIDTQVSLQLYQQHEALVLIRQAYMYVSMIKLVDALMPTCLFICLPLSLFLSPLLSSQPILSEAILEQYRENKSSVPPGMTPDKYHEVMVEQIFSRMIILFSCILYSYGHTLEILWRGISRPLGQGEFPVLPGQGQ